MDISKREREQQERENMIIDKAIDLFCEYGFDSITMERIAQESDFTKRTVYRYFSSKEDLFFATALRGHQILYDILREAIKKGTTGFDKVRHSFYAYSTFISEHPRLARLVNQNRYSKSENTDQPTTYYQKFNELDRLLFEELRQVFVLGQEDQSIRNDLSINQLAHSTIYTAVGLFQLLSFTGETYTKHFGYDKEAFVQFSIDRILETVQMNALDHKLTPTF